MKVTYIEDLRDYLPFSQDGATDEEIGAVCSSVHDLDALYCAIRNIFAARYIRFSRDYVSIENDYFYPIFRIYATGMDEEGTGCIIKLKK